MSADTVKPAVRAKRGKRVVETSAFDAFARRILRAYARRVAAGDVEALRSLTMLSAEVDAVTRLAVVGLRQAPYSYSWSEIADRLGTTRQASQMRYGERTERGGLDRRLLDAGLTVTVAALVEVFADHHPGQPASPACPGCGYRYPKDVSDCPSLATVRPLLYRRRAEDKHAVARLSTVQLADLQHTRSRTTTPARSTRPMSNPTGQPLSLFDLAAGKDPTS